MINTIFIRLTNTNKKIGAYHLAIDRIVYFYKDIVSNTTIVETDLEPLEVQESPEEITRIINRLQTLGNY